MKFRGGRHQLAPLFYVYVFLFFKFLGLNAEDEAVAGNLFSQRWIELGIFWTPILPALFGFRGPVHAYVAVPGEKTCYLPELQAGKEVLVVNPSGMQRTAIVGQIKIESRPLILVDAKKDSDEETTYSIILQNTETVRLVNPSHGLLSPQGINSLVLEYFTAVLLVFYFLPVSLVTEEKPTVTAIPITSLKVGDEVMLRLQGGARHTGIEIDEFIVER